MSYLYFTENGLHAGIEQHQVVVSNAKHEPVRRIPIESVDGIAIFGTSQMSTSLIKECIERRIPVEYYSNDGHYFGSIESSMQIDPHRQKMQVYLTDDEAFCLEWSKRVIGAKLFNSITLLDYFSEYHEFDSSDWQGLQHSMESLRAAESVEMVLGLEGNAAKSYFKCLSQLLADTDFAFHGRSARPPKDQFNSMISFGYSLLYRNIIGAITRHGLHPYFAFMHKLKFGHAALASDLIEEFRAPIVDRIVIQLILDGDVDAEEFYENGAGAIYMRKSASRRLANNLSEAITHDERYFYGYGARKSYGFQALLDKKVASVVDAIDHRDATRYVPFVWRS